MFIPAEDYKRIQELLPILCVDCVIIHEQRCLLIRRLMEPAKSQYWFPGGRVLKKELIRDAAIRKAHEEVHVECTYKGVIAVQESIFPRKNGMTSDIHTVNVCCQLFAASIETFTLDSSHDAYKWVNLEAAKILALHPAVFEPISIVFKSME